MLKIFISTSKIQSPSTGKKLLSPFSKKFKKSSVLWLDRQKRDHYTKKARRMNYRSRAAFKLLELNISSNILHRGNRVFDLGCSPGGWSQVAAQLVRSPPNNPKVYGIDLLETDPFEGAIFTEGDIHDEKAIAELLLTANMRKADVLMSDISPSLIGNQDVDLIRMSEMNLLSVSLGNKLLRKGGNIVMKTFDGYKEKEFFNLYKLVFREFFRVKPPSSRKESSEMYYVGKGFQLGDFYKKVLEFDEEEEDLENNFFESLGWNENMKDSLKLSLSILNENNIELFPNDKKILERAIYGNLNFKRDPKTEEESVSFEDYVKKDNSLISDSRKSQVSNLIERMKKKEKIKERNIKFDPDFEIMDIEEDLETGVSGNFYKESSDMEKNIDEFEVLEEKIESNTSSFFDNFFESTNLVKKQKLIFF